MSAEPSGKRRYKRSWSGLICQLVVVDSICKKGPSGEGSVYVTEVKLFSAVHHKAMSLGVGPSIENSRELCPSQLVSIVGCIVLPSAQRDSENWWIFLKRRILLRIISCCFDHKPELRKSSMIAQSFPRCFRGRQSESRMSSQSNR